MYYFLIFFPKDAFITESHIEVLSLCDLQIYVSVGGAVDKFVTLVVHN